MGGMRCTMVFTSVAGHLMEIDFDPAFKSWDTTNPRDLFTCAISKRVPDKSRDIATNLR